MEVILKTVLNRRNMRDIIDCLIGYFLLGTKWIISIAYFFFTVICSSGNIMMAFEMTCNYGFCQYTLIEQRINNLACFFSLLSCHIHIVIYILNRGKNTFIHTHNVFKLFICAFTDSLSILLSFIKR